MRCAFFAVYCGNQVDVAADGPGLPSGGSTQGTVAVEEAPAIDGLAGKARNEGLLE